MPSCLREVRVKGRKKGKERLKREGRGQGVRDQLELCVSANETCRAIKAVLQSRKWIVWVQDAEGDIQEMFRKRYEMRVS